MAKNRKGTLPILLDLHYSESMNKFEEFYGDGVSYSSVEQESYIDFKEMMFQMVGNVKFRKFGRDKNILTIKADITPDEYELFLRILKEEEVDVEATNDIDNNPEKETKYLRFNFLHDFTITDIRDLTNAERIRFKKNVEEIEEELN